LVALAEQPITPVTPAVSDVSIWRVAAVMVGLAASIAIAVLAVRAPQQDAPRSSSPDLIASSDLSTGTGQPDSPSEQPVAVAPGGELPDSGTPAPNTLAGETGPRSGGTSGPKDLPSGPPSTRDVAATDAEPSTDVAVLTEGATTDGGSESNPPMRPGAIESIAASDLPSGDVSPESATSASPSLPSQFGAVLVLDVRRTETGRQSEVVSNAMAAVEITKAHRKEVSDQVAQFVADSEDRLETDASVFYLQLSAKQFDLLYQQLWADEEGVQSVRMAVVLDAPLLNVVEAIRPDPTSVRHESAAFELFSQSGVVEQLAHELSELPFPPAQRGASAVGKLGSGPDIQTQVLMLVR
jgi:hypothetical protein